MEARLATTAALLGLFLAGATHPKAHAMDVREALGQIESGAISPKRSAADNKVGSRKEVSRFQILPQLWRRYGRTADHRDPEAAWGVASRILEEREAWFRGATGREWEPIDIYIMWNAPGVYERAGWDRRKVSRVVLERAKRFANLMALDDRVLVRAGAQELQP